MSMVVRRSKPETTFKFFGYFNAPTYKVMERLGGNAMRTRITSENREDVVDMLAWRSDVTSVWFVEDDEHAAGVYVNIVVRDDEKTAYTWWIAADSRAYAESLISKMGGTGLTSFTGTDEKPIVDGESDEEDDDDEDDDDDDERQTFDDGEVVHLNSDTYAVISSQLGDHFEGVNEYGDKIKFVYDDIDDTADLDDARSAIIMAFDLDTDFLDGIGNGNGNIVRWKGRLTMIEDVDASDWQLAVAGEWIDIGPGEDEIKANHVDSGSVFPIDSDVWVNVKDGDEEFRLHALIKGLNVEEQKYVVEPYEEEFEVSDRLLESY